MKNINGTKKISLKAGTADADLYKMILEQDPGLKKLLVEPGLSAYLTSDGTTIEIYGAGFSLPDYLFSNSNIVISYKVGNLVQMIKDLEHKGARLLGEIEHVCTSYKYCHLLTPDDTVIGIYEQA